MDETEPAEEAKEEMNSTKLYAWIIIVVVAVVATGCAPIVDALRSTTEQIAKHVPQTPKTRQPAPVQVNYRGCRFVAQCESNIETLQSMKNDCNAYPNYDCSQYDPLIAHLEGQRSKLLVLERVEEERLAKLREEAQLRHEESMRQENEKREKRDRDIQERIDHAKEARRLVDECTEKRAVAKRTCDAWLNANCKPVLVSRTGCQQFTERTWAKTTTWTECVDTYKAQCVKADTAPSLCKPEAANGEVFSNAYIDQCSTSTADIRASEGR